MMGQQLPFVTATHSPISIAFPCAEILNFEGNRIEAVRFDDLDHAQVMHEFPNHPDAFLQRLCAWRTFSFN